MNLSLFGKDRENTSSPSPAPRTRGIELYVAIGVVVIASMVVLALFFAGFFNPKVEMTSSILRRGGGLLANYWVSVDISLYNHGWSGTVTVWAEITYKPTGESWRKAQTVYLGSKESKDITITFTFGTEVYFGEFSHRVWLT